MPYQDEDNPFPETSHSQLQSEETFKEEHEEAGDSRANQLEKEFPAYKEPGARYTIAEDLQLLNYTKIHPLPSIGSRKYWQQAIKDPSFPCKYRPVESLRDRYRYQLRFVEEADKKRMKEWVEKYGNKGYSLFNTVPLKGARGKKGIRRKLVLFGLEDTIGCHISVDSIEKVSSIQSDKSNNKNSTAMRKTNEGLEESHSVGSIEHEEEMPADSSYSQLQDTEVRKSKARIRYSLADTDKTNKTNANSKKRKGYQHMSETDGFLMPYKAIKSNLDANLLDIEHESTLTRDIEDNTYEMVSRECLRKSKLLDLFYSCSMNLNRVREYLKSNQSVAWNEQEDRLLMCPEREIHIKTLSLLKGAANVRERIEFLDKFNELFRDTKQID